MAGLGRRVFAAGEILTAANLQGFAVDQSVMVFDDATARAQAIPTPSEGMVTYLKEDEAVTFFDGSVFRAVGGLVAVKSAIRDTPFSQAVSGAGNVAVGGLEIVHEVADPANRLIISANFGVAASSRGQGNVGLAVFDGAGIISGPDSPGDRSAVHAGGRVSVSQSDQVVTMPSVTFLHTPGAGSKTYTVQALNLRGVTETLFINRGERDDDVSAFTRSVSSLVIQEVAV